jgi:hypothetical protein
MEIVPPNVNLQLSIRPRDSISRGALTCPNLFDSFHPRSKFSAIEFEKKIRLDDNSRGFSRLRFLGWEAENQFEEVF